jgi:hypothetical protein
MFPSQVAGKDGCMSNNTILVALGRMGYKGIMTGHGFRGIASTALHEQGFDHKHIELQLAHAERNQVSASYNHALYLEQRKKMMQDWADYIDKLTKGADDKPERISMAQAFVDSQNKLKELRMKSEKSGKEATLPPVNNSDELSPQSEQPLTMAQALADSFDKKRGKDILTIVGVK